MSYFERLRQRELIDGPICVAVVGSGFVGRGMIRQLTITDGMTPSVVVNRTTSRAVSSYEAAGWRREEVVVSDDPDTLSAAISDGLPAVSPSPGVLRELSAVDVVVEASGAVEYGSVVCLDALRAGRHVISMNFESDATVGALLRRSADENGVVYTGSDGDQPGVMSRLVDYVQGIGLTVAAAVNCKGFLDVHATPDTIREFAERQKTSLPMTTAFTDGTKMNVENASLANATGLVPERRGMHGVQTTLADALDDFSAVLVNEGVVDYTLGGDFRAGVFVIGRSDNAEVQHYLNYLKMGSGPWHLFFRPWHLVHMETPLSIAKAVLDGQATIAPRLVPVVDVVTIAKRDLVAGEPLDGIGGYTTYGQIDTVENAAGLLPVGLTAHATMVRSVARDRPVTLDDVELDSEAPLVRLRAEQNTLVRDGDTVA